ncbi:hypothetical protein SGPA1_20003 [Streptomyces misionensis JCM 4497]
MLRGGGQQPGPVGDPGQHQQRVHPAVERALDVGVQPVPDHERAPRARPQDRLPVHGRQRLARHLRLLARRDPYDLDGRAVARRDPASAGDRQIGVGREPRNPAPHRVRGLREPPPGQLHPAVPLHDRRRIVVRRLHRHQAPLAQCHPQSLAADHQHPRPGRHLLGDQPRHRLRRGDDVVGARRYPQLGQVLRDRLRRTQRVVGDVRQMHTPRAGPLQRGDRVRDRLPARVHHPVQVEQRRVVRLVQGLLTAPRTGTDALAHMRVSPRSLAFPPIIPHTADTRTMPGWTLQVTRKQWRAGAWNSPRSAAFVTTPTGSAAWPPSPPLRTTSSCGPTGCTTSSRRTRTTSSG